MPEFTPESPNGRQHQLRHGDQEVVVTEVGATLREYRLGDRAVVAGFGADQVCPGGRGQHLIPWPNRIGDGRYSFAGRQHQLAINEPERNNAIHGLVRWVSWDAVETGPAALTLRHRLHAQPGYAFSLDLTVDYALGDDGLAVTTSARNLGAEAAPYGSGAHPYLTVATATIDPCSLRLPAATRLLADDRQLPIQRVTVEGSEFDFREPRTIGGLRLDTAFTDLVRDSDGRARVMLRSSAGDEVMLWVDPGYRWLMVYSGDTLGDVDMRRRAIAIEPMTCPPDAFRSGEDVIILQPGEATAARWGIDISGFRTGVA